MLEDIKEYYRVVGRSKGVRLKREELNKLELELEELNKEIKIEKRGRLEISIRDKGEVKWKRTRTWVEKIKVSKVLNYIDKVLERE